MPLSLKDALAVLARPFIHAAAARQALADARPSLSLEELRALHLQQLEQELARERLRLSSALHRPFNGLL